MKKKAQTRILVAAAVLLLAAANWPLLALVNRVHPFLLGLPPFVFAMLVLNLLVALLLFVAYRLSE